jgi:hypothetical protein
MAEHKQGKLEISMNVAAKGLKKAIQPGLSVK